MCDCNLRSCCCCLPIGKSVQIWMVVDVLIHAALASLAFVWGLFPWCAGWLLLTSLGSLSLAVLICRRKVRYQNIKRGEIINLERHIVFEKNILSVMQCWIWYYAVHCFILLSLWIVIPAVFFFVTSTKVKESCVSVTEDLDSKEWYDCSNEILSKAMDQEGPILVLVYVIVIILTCINLYFWIAVRTYELKLRLQSAEPPVIPLYYHSVSL